MVGGALPSWRERGSVRLPNHSETWAARRLWNRTRGKMGAEYCVMAWSWNKAKEEAAQLIADGRLNQYQIAERVGFTRDQVNRWKQLPEFQARINEILKAWEEHVRSRWLCRKDGRLEALIADWEATEIIRVERGKLMENDPNAGGGRTGFICRDYRGKDADVPVYVFDAALFRARREVYEQIADELGQLVKRTEITGADGGPVGVDMTMLRVMLTGAMGELAPEVRASISKKLLDGDGPTQDPG